MGSCKKDKTSTLSENPVKAAIVNPSLLDSFTLFPSFGSSYEVGLKIHFLKDGTVTKLGCRAGNKGTYSVSLWDYETTNLIASSNITVTDSLQYTYKSITPVSVSLDKHYVISMNTNSGGVAKDYWIFYRKISQGTISMNIYPFTSGNIIFEEIRSKETNTPTFPTLVSSPWNFIAQADLQFEYNE